MLYSSRKEFLKALYHEVSVKGDFPAVSHAAWKTIAVMDLEQEQFDLAQAILDDAALTQKVLRTANSSMYSRFGQNVTTVTQAIMLLGYEKIGHLALSLKVTGDLLAASKSKDERAQRALHQCVITGTLTRHLAKRIYAPNAEVAGVCGLLFGIGRVMVTFYLPSTWGAVQSYASKEGLPEGEAMGRLLGITDTELSYEVAKHWGLPKGVVDVLGVQEIPSATRGAALSHVQWLSQIVKSADNLNKKLESVRYAPKESELKSFSAEFCGQLGMREPDFVSAVQGALTEEENNPLIGRVPPQIQESSGEYVAGKDVLRSLYALRATLKVEAKKHSARSLMAMAAEALHTTFGAKRTALMLKCAESSVLRVRAVLGKNAAQALNGFSLETGYAPDAFHLAIARNIPLLVSNAKGLKASGKLPLDYIKRAPEAPPFLLLPLNSNELPLGLLYLDWPADARVPSLTEEEKVCLVSIRDILVDALESMEAAA